MSARTPAVAGLFYPADAPRLRAQVAELMAAAPVAAAPQPKALIVPHAGYRYSGATAARAYARLRDGRATIRRVLLLGPAHRVYLAGMALPSVDSFATPLGHVAVDDRAREAASALPGVSIDDRAHAQEHSLEVHLPFLQIALDSFKVLPVVVGDCPADRVARLLDEFWVGDGTLLVISSDLSHFHDSRTAEAQDRRTCERILAKSGDLGGDEACGCRPLNGLMHARAVAGLDIELLGLCNSGDSGGDRERVVGYGAFALH